MGLFNKIGEIFMSGAEGDDSSSSQEVMGQEERSVLEAELAEINQRVATGAGVISADDANRRRDIERMLGGKDQMAA